MSFSSKPSLKKMWKLSWMKNGQSEPEADDGANSMESEQSPAIYAGSSAQTPPAVTIDKATSDFIPVYRGNASEYMPTSPLSLSQPASMRSFMKAPPSQASSCPSNRGPFGSMRPASPARSGMKRKDSIVSSTGRMADIRSITPTDGKLDFLTYLPYEIAMVIVIYADFPTIMTISQVSKSWNRFAHDNAVWRRLFLQQREWRTSRALATAFRNSSNMKRSAQGDSGNSSILCLSPSPGISPSASGINTPKVGDDAFATPDSMSPLTNRILSAYSGSSLRPAINLQHMVAPSPTLSMVNGFEGQKQRQQLLQPQKRTAPDWRYLFQQRLRLDRHWSAGIADMHILTGHADSVYCVQYDHDKIVTGSRDRTIKIWDSNTLQCLRTMTGHDASVLCLKYDDTVLVTGSSDATVIVWDWESGTPKLRLVSHAAGVLDVAFDQEHIVSCSKDCTIKVWRRSDGKLLRTMAGHRGPVNAVQLCNNRIVSASGDSLIKMWNLKTGELIRTFTGHSRGLACVQFDGKTVVSGSSDQLIKVWDAETGECKQTLRGHKDLVRTLHYDGGNRAVSGSYDQTIKVWDIASGKCTLDLKDAHTSWVFDVQFSASKIVSTSQDQKIIIWDFAKGLDVADIN
ncbi:hypothetical protein LPJ78_002600 [Coemansia sp. RSA 989]|nr:hypothetical protein LPJ78_002600 [Coemansia sp. RSA 989]KAJ1873481.1 hypothetical protein LPJ55_002229 [Coemansia sp. RSA 990]KAJ2650360.1 hypothetical protein IWW40_002537 [Coemansia sp. RSA 1250]